MRIVLDLDQLEREGKLSPTEAERLKQFAARDTTSMAINILVAVGSLAIVAGMLALLPHWEMAVLLGLVLFAIGWTIQHYAAGWALLGTTNAVTGALILAAGCAGWLGLEPVGFIVATLVLLLGAVLVRSGLLGALAALALAGSLRSSTGYFDATYYLVVREAAFTVLLFGLLALLGLLASQRLAQPYRHVALAFARMSFILVNFGMWIGTLWGDRPGESWVYAVTITAPTADWMGFEEWVAAALFIPPVAFILAWAALIVGIGIWGVRSNRRWVVNVATVFGAIHFYTQWFEHLGAEPWTVIVGGVIVIAIAVGLWRYNRTAAAVVAA